MLVAAVAIGCGGAPAKQSNTAGRPGSRPRMTPNRQPAEVMHDPAGDTAAEMRIHAIDVGQGLAMLLEFPCGAMLIDTGAEHQPDRDNWANLTYNGSKQLMDYLAAFFARRTDLNKTLDVAFLTHPHKDHTRNILRVMRSYTVKNLVTTGLTRGSGSRFQNRARDLANAGTKTRLSELARPANSNRRGYHNQRIDPLNCVAAGVDPDIRVLWGRVPGKNGGTPKAANAGPPSGWTKSDWENLNNHSLVIRVQYGAFSALFTGDLEQRGIEGLVKHRAKSVIDVDVYQVGHHGADNGTTPAFLKALTPTMALIGAGLYNRKGRWNARQYGHPRIALVGNLVKHVSKRRKQVTVPVAVAQYQFVPFILDRAVYNTGWHGSFVVHAHKDGKHWVTGTRLDEDVPGAPY